MHPTTIELDLEKMVEETGFSRDLIARTLDIHPDIQKYEGVGTVDEAIALVQETTDYGSADQRTRLYILQNLVENEVAKIKTKEEAWELYSKLPFGTKAQEIALEKFCTFIETQEEAEKFFTEYSYKFWSLRKFFLSRWCQLVNSKDELLVLIQKASSSRDIEKEILIKAVWRFYTC